MPSTPKNPAPFNKDVLTVIERELCRQEFVGTILDPFAGSGGVHKLPWFTIGIELEPEWASEHEWTRVGNALSLPFPDDTFDAVVTSPTYGNRYADHHDAQDDSIRYSYKHNLGRDPSPGSSAVMQWGEEYRGFHREAWREAHRVLKRDGLFVLNIKNHVRGGVVQQVVEWHRNVLSEMGGERLRTAKVKTPGDRRGANSEARVDHEVVYVFRLPAIGLRHF